jgi:uncharacterized protein YecE (DUF72 family)
MPNVLTVKKWANTTPENFRFAAKMPGQITHDNRLGKGTESALHYFYEAMMPLKEKTTAILIQLPPTMTKQEGFKKFKNLALDDRFRHALEVRHKSWFDGEVYDYLKENDICLAWSQLADMQTPPVLTSNFVYLRLIGDRSIPESEFNKIQKDRLKEMHYWATELERVQTGHSLKMVIVAANNHYAGFGPGTANNFRKMLDLPEALYYENGQSKQPSLLDH